jgi:hypothetical protein
VKDVSGMRVQVARPRLTASLPLLGGQDRLRQLILYVSLRCEKAERFGRIKLNKIIWRADFEAYAQRKLPITGRAYQKLEWGPAAKEMLPLLNEMLRLGVIEYHETDFGEDRYGERVIEQRPIAKLLPNLEYFTRSDIEFVEDSIDYYWGKTGNESSDDSHGMAWKSRNLKETIYYELAYLSDEPITDKETRALIERMTERGVINKGAR